MPHGKDVQMRRSPLEQPRSWGALMKLLAVGVALVAGSFGVISAPYVTYDTYLIVVRHLAFLAVPWIGVWGAFRGSYRITAACFAITAAAGYWISDFQVWGIPVVGGLLTVGTLAQPADRGPA